VKDQHVTNEDLKCQPAWLKSGAAQLKQLESERRKVTEALRQSETLFRKITEKSIVGVYLIQEDVFSYVNPMMASFFGWGVGDLVDKRGPQDCVFEEDWPLVHENLRKRLCGEIEAINYRFRGIRTSGEVFNVEVYGSRTKYQGGPAVIGTLLDITHRLEAERNLQMQLHRFQALYNIAVATAAEHTLEENLALLVDKCRELIGTDVSLVAVSGENLDRILVSSQSGLREAALNKLPLGFLEKQRLEVSPGRPGDHTEPCFRALKRMGKSVFQGESLVSGIAIPLRAGTKAVGVLCVGSRSKRDFSDSEKDVLALVGNVAALEITRRGAEQAFARSEDRLRRLSEQLLSAHEGARKRLARELHDGIGQSLSAIKFKIENVMKQIRPQLNSDCTAQLEMLVPMIQNTVEEVQRIAVDLRPFMLDDLGLVATLNWFLREFQSTYSHIRLDGRIGLREHEVPESLKIVIFRIIQEALNNVARHSRAEHVLVTLGKRKDRIELLIKDNGVGIDGDSVSRFSGSVRGFGLASMKERTELSGGMFRLDTGARSGTSIRASWPFTTSDRPR